MRELCGLRDARVVGVADPHPEARQRAQQLTGASTHERAEELLRRDDVDAVVISAPTYLHAELAIAAAVAAKHIYIEKPLATTAEEGTAVLEAVRRANVQAVVGFNRRFHPLYRHARRLISEGSIGHVRGVVTVFSEPVAGDAMPEWRRRRSSGGGVLLDLASHHIDLLRWYLSDEVVQVSASIESAATEDDQAWLRLRMRSGIESRSFFSFRAGRADWVEFIGESGTLRVDRHRAFLSLRVPRLFGYGMRSGLVAPPFDVVRWWTRRVRRPSYEPSYRESLLSFIECIRTRKPPAIAEMSLQDGLKTLEVILAAEKSSRAGAFAAVPVGS
jgi:predicted dehydrogenase